ncbi:MAG TPA: hypothetical protein VF203_07705 [Burkholderiales bacterium]
MAIKAYKKPRKLDQARFYEIPPEQREAVTKAFALQLFVRPLMRHFKRMSNDDWEAVRAIYKRSVPFQRARSVVGLQAKERFKRKGEATRNRIAELFQQYKPRYSAHEIPALIAKQMRMTSTHVNRVLRSLGLKKRRQDQ